jgi:hypothetical protein
MILILTQCCRILLIQCFTNPVTLSDHHHLTRTLSGGGDKSASPLFGEVSLDVSSPPLSDLLVLTDEEFRARFADTAIVRIGVHRFLRNVAVAAGNSKDITLLPHLLATRERLLADVKQAHALLTVPVPEVLPDVTPAEAHVSGQGRGGKPRPRKKVKGEGAARVAREKAAELAVDVDMICEHIDWAMGRLRNPATVTNAQTSQSDP